MNGEELRRSLGGAAGVIGQVTTTGEWCCKTLDGGRVTRGWRDRRRHAVCLPLSSTHHLRHHHPASAAVRRRGQMAASGVRSTSGEHFPAGIGHRKSRRGDYCRSQTTYVVSIRTKCNSCSRRVLEAVGRVQSSLCLTEFTQWQPYRRSTVKLHYWHNYKQTTDK